MGEEVKIVLEAWLGEKREGGGVGPWESGEGFCEMELILWDNQKKDRKMRRGDG